MSGSAKTCADSHFALLLPIPGKAVLENNTEAWRNPELMQSKVESILDQSSKVNVLVCILVNLESSAPPKVKSESTDTKSGAMYS